MKSDYIRLSFFGLPLMQSLDDFAQLTHISKFTIYQLSQHAEENYLVFEVSKKNGKKRTICEPSKNLKGIQAWILHNILYKLNVSSACMGFEKKTSTKDNADAHKFSNAILTVDITEFFPSIPRNKVYNIFKSVGYNSLISTILTNLCVYKNCLPQGSPCSPRLANLTTWKLDLRIQKYVGKRGITYTRYADDLSISGMNPGKVINSYQMIKKIVESEGFYLNPKKTRMAGASRAKKITGLIISEDNTGIGLKLYKKLRSKIYHLTISSEQGNIKLISEVQGWLSYLNSVDKKRLSNLEKYIEKLKKSPDNSTYLIQQIITAANRR